MTQVFPAKAGKTASRVEATRKGADFTRSGGAAQITALAGILAAARASAEMPSDLVSRTHALVQDAHDADAGYAHAVDNNVGTDQIGKMRRRQVGTTLTELRIVAYRLQRIVELVAIGPKAVWPPFFAGITQYVDEILPGLWRELKWRGSTGGHPDRSACRYAWR